MSTATENLGGSLSVGRLGLVSSSIPNTFLASSCSLASICSSVNPAFSNFSAARSPASTAFLSSILSSTGYAVSLIALNKGLRLMLTLLKSLCIFASSPTNSLPLPIVIDSSVSGSLMLNL